MYEQIKQILQSGIIRNNIITPKAILWREELRMILRDLKMVFVDIKYFQKRNRLNRLKACWTYFKHRKNRKYLRES